MSELVRGRGGEKGGEGEKGYCEGRGEVKGGGLSRVWV